MKFNTQGYKESRWTFIILIAILWLFSFILIYDAFKTREDFKVIKGEIIEQGNTTQKGRRNVTNYVYYFRLNNHYQTLGVRTNKSLEPILDESFRGVNVGDIIQVTFEENWATNLGSINLMVREIIRGREILYDNIPRTYWNGRFKFGITCFLIGSAILLLFLFFQSKYKRVTKLGS